MAPVAVRRRSVAGRPAHRVARRTALCRCSGIAGRLKWGSRSCRRRLDGPRWPRPLRSAPPHATRRSRLAHAERRAGDAPAGGAGVPPVPAVHRTASCGRRLRDPTRDRAKGGTPEAIHEVGAIPDQREAHGGGGALCPTNSTIPGRPERAEAGRMSTSKTGVSRRSGARRHRRRAGRNALRRTRLAYSGVEEDDGDVDVQELEEAGAQLDDRSARRRGRIVGAADHRPERSRRTPLRRNARRRTRRPSTGAAGAHRSRPNDGVGADLPERLGATGRAPNARLAAPWRPGLST